MLLSAVRPSRLLRLSILPAALLLGACQSKLEADIGVSTPPATIESLNISVPYVDFKDTDSDVHSFDADDDSTFDILEYLNDDDDDNDDDVFKVFEDKSAKGDYASVRPRFDVSAGSLVTSTGAEYPLTLVSQPDYISYPLSVGKDDSETLLLTLELTFSLIDDTSNSGDYEFKPVIRVARSDTAGEIDGTISTSLVQASSCRDGRTVGTGVAAYLYSGSGITPTDYYKTDDVTNSNQPVAAAFVEYSSDDDAYAFKIRNVEPGTYTIAWTCQADSEDPETDDDLTFIESEDVTVSTSSTSTVSFTGSD
ncbi:hypothetical protein [Solimonas marina]|uniref:DUF4382 domain-containing protein n=1 Tax=Solimonas marina TaxID=2714601 RepID=A0A969WAQ3_9GAMM|nr:hypothetical protein [Solimonas marina]NKF23936.1 hypothetical protein [Solimonas marina]